jgi:hypothetical protein
LIESRGLVVSIHASLLERSGNNKSVIRLNIVTEVFLLLFFNLPEENVRKVFKIM